MIHGLKPFKYKNICELCDNIQEIYKIRIIMVKKYSVLSEEVIAIFHEQMYISTIEKLPFLLSCVRILGSVEFESTRNDFSMVMHQKTIWN